MILKIFSVIVGLLSNKWVKDLLPGNLKAILERFDTIAPVVAEVIEIAASKDLDNAEKKKHASEELLKRFQSKHIDIPGDADLQVCEILVEAVYQSLKNFS